MREMVLNHASLTGFAKQEVVDNLRDVAAGMAQLVKNGVTGAVLRTSKPIQDISCLPGCSLFNAFLFLRESDGIDEFRFLMSLAARTPILEGLGESVESQFLACEATEMPVEDGTPLLLCALTDWVAVGFPKLQWDRDEVTVMYEELLPDDTTITVSEKIDNLSRAEHADPIYMRHLSRARLNVTLRDFWDRRETLFPRLLFGPDVRQQIRNLRPELGQTIINRLSELHVAAEKWVETGGTMPRWICKVTPESESVRKNRKLCEERRFRSCSGTSELFLWHARFGSNGRIHLRFDPEKYEVEIGYIGRHLPL